MLCEAHWNILAAHKYDRSAFTHYRNAAMHDCFQIRFFYSHLARCTYQYSHVDCRTMQRYWSWSSPAILHHRILTSVNSPRLDRGAPHVFTQPPPPTWPWRRPNARPDPSINPTPLKPCARPTDGSGHVWSSPLQTSARERKPFFLYTEPDPSQPSAKTNVFLQISARAQPTQFIGAIHLALRVGWNDCLVLSLQAELRLSRRDSTVLALPASRQSARCSRALREHRVGRPANRRDQLAAMHESV
jgi:hypothetical protein